MQIRKLLRNAVLEALDPVYRPSRKRTVMIHHGRCGSSVLGMMLNEHPKLYWSGELLKAPRVVLHKQRMEVFDYTKVIRQDEVYAGRKNYGFEMKYMHMRQLQISKKQFLADMDELGYAYIVLLERQNFLRREVSSMIGNITGQFHLKQGSVTTLSPIVLNTETLMSLLDQLSIDHTEMLELLKDRPFLYLTYEDDIQQDPTVAYGKICTFLDIPYSPVPPKLQRTNPFPLSAMLLNFEEVSATLKGSKYEWMLEL